MIQTSVSGLPREAQLLGPWFHNLHLPGGVQTAPEHFLGDFPSNKWQLFCHTIPDDLHGWTALDVGCNAGFYSFELARRGAQVTAIDYDERYLQQARWAAELYGLQNQIRFRKRQIYELAQTDETYDIVWFMGVLYHLRYPLLGLDIVTRITRQILVLQTMTSPGDAMTDPPLNMRLDERHRMQDAGWPRMAFIEHRLQDDPTNWWAPNQACVEAMLRSADMEVVHRPAHEITICRPAATTRDSRGLRAQEFLAATGQSSTGRDA